MIFFPFPLLSPEYCYEYVSLTLVSVPNVVSISSSSGDTLGGYEVVVGFSPDATSIKSIQAEKN